MARKRSSSVRFGGEDFTAWEANDGEVIPITEMDIGHLANAIRWIRTHGRRRGYLPKLELELARREADAGRPPGMEPQAEVNDDPWDGPIVLRKTLPDEVDEVVDERPPVDPDLDDLLDDVFDPKG